MTLSAVKEANLVYVTRLGVSILCRQRKFKEVIEKTTSKLNLLVYDSMLGISHVFPAFITPGIRLCSQSIATCGKLMHDFSCTDADDMFYGILAERVRYFKEDAKRVESMRKVMEDMRYDEKEETALQMIARDKYEVEEVADISGLTLEEVKALITQKTA